jgi:hypothetical protein
MALLRLTLVGVIYVSERLVEARKLGNAGFTVAVSRHRLRRRRIDRSAPRR